MKRFDAEETELLSSFEHGEWKSGRDVKAEMKRFRRYAADTLKKDARVNIRLPSRVLEELKERAVEEGIPYQTLISSILYKYVQGRLEEKRPARQPPGFPK